MEEASTKTTMSDLLISFGIEALTICSKKNHSEEHCDFCMMTTSYVSPSATASWVVGDYIGTESCYDLYNNTTEHLSGAGSGGGVCSERRVKREQPFAAMMMKKRDLPPPLPSLARTENRSSHMPWVLKRYYTEDGRLILKEEKVKHHEYFKANRCDGRLTLHLIPLDDYVDDDFDDDDGAKEEDDDDDDESNMNVDTLLKDNNGIEDSMGKCSIPERVIQMRMGWQQIKESA